MLFTVKKENIIEGLQKAAGIIPTRAGAAYLRSLWIKAEGEVLTIMMRTSSSPVRIPPR